MNFDLNNYNNFDKFFSKTRKNREKGIVIEKNQKISPIFSIPQIINKLNNEPILNPLINQNITITFEDFDWLGKTKVFLKDFGKKQQYKFKQNIGFYNPDTKTIHVFNGVIKEGYRTPNYDRTFRNFLEIVSNEMFVPKFFLLHEIGHAIHDQIKKENLNNLTEYFKKEGCIFYNNLATICNENFADAFSSIALLIIEKNNPNIIKDLKTIITHRNNTIDEDYFTVNTLNIIIKDFEKNKLNFNSFNEMKDYVLDLTNKELKIRIQKTLEINHMVGKPEETDRQLGYLAGLFNKNINTILPFLEKEIFYNNINTIIIDNFNYGLNQYKVDSIQKNNIKNKIFACREVFLENQSTNLNKPII